MRAYRAAGIDPTRIFVVDTEGTLRTVADGTESSYPRHADRVDQMYPNRVDRQ